MVEILAGFMCTDEEIAETIGTTVDTLTNKNNGEAFSEAKKRGQSKGKASLRRHQFKLAEHNAAMAIFLGKQYLGQSDNPRPEEAADDPLIKMLEAWDNASSGK